MGLKTEQGAFPCYGSFDLDLVFCSQVITLDDVIVVLYRGFCNRPSKNRLFDMPLELIKY